jgi:CrcB protein
MAGARVSAGTLLAVAVLGGAGAVARFLLDGAVAARLGRAFPFGTFAVNVSGAFALGVLVGAAVGEGTYRLAGTAFLGAYTTFSTWAFESHRLGEDGRLPVAALNFGGSLVCGVVAAWAGRGLGGLL